MALIAVGSNRLSELIEAGSDTELFGEGVDAEFVVAASNVLDDGWSQTGRFRLAPREGGIGPEAGKSGQGGRPFRVRPEQQCRCAARRRAGSEPIAPCGSGDAVARTVKRWRLV